MIWQEKTTTTPVAAPVAIPFEERFIVRPATMDDVEDAVALFESCSLAMIGVNDVSLDDVRNEWLLPKFDLNAATRLVFTPDNELVGYIEVWDTNDPAVKVWVWGRVHPAYEGQGIGTYLMEWAEARAQQVLPRVPQELQVVMQAGTFKGYRPGHELMAGHGMSLIRHFYTMAAELNGRPPEAEWPENITVRPMANIEESRAVIEAVRDAFRDHWGYVEQPFEDEYEHWRHFMDNGDEFDPSLWFLALDGEEIAGISLCWPKSHDDPKMGWVSTLGVRRPWRKQGLGLALLQHSFAEFQRRGQARVGLGVDASSLTGALRLYERAGMRPIRQFDMYQKMLRPGKDISTQTV